MGRGTGKDTKGPEGEKLQKEKQTKQEDLNGRLDEALDETFPASDPPALLEPAPEPKAD